MSKNRRRFFRLEYPIAAGPKLVSSGVQLEVLDISEQGLRLKFKTESELTFSVGSPFAGSLTFPDGESLLVFGIVQRINEEQVSVQLRRPIPLQIIMAEQRRIIRNFKRRA